jgi:hypothetical protein
MVGMFSSSNSLEYEKPGLFERLPPPRKRLLGCERHVLLRLHDAGLIRIIEVKRPGYKRSLQLVHVPSVIAYFERVEELARNEQLAKIRAGYAKHHQNHFLSQLDEPQAISFEQPEDVQP